MYTSYIGKKFLKIFNEREEKNYSAEEFFDKIQFNIFFDDNAHLMHVGNSPFFQKPKDEDIKKYGGKSLAQYNNLKTSIDNDAANMSIFVGSAAKDIGGTTSGQITNIDFKIEKDEMYASWIGEALGIGISGGIVILIDEPEILWILYHGWQYYRKYLNQTPNVKDKQIETWNGHWLWYSSQIQFNNEDALNNLNIKTSEVQGNIAIPTLQWIKVIFALAKKFPQKNITSYAYSLSQTNITLGFIKFFLPEVNRIFELRDKIFLDENKSILKDEEIEQLTTFYTFKNACKIGTIGLNAMEPAHLREYMPKGSVQYAQGKEYKFTDENSFTNYQLYKIWIIAMLNKTELLNLASKVAEALINTEKSDDRGKKVFSSLSQEVRESSNLKTFIDKLTEVLNHLPSNAEIFREVVINVLKMPADNFPLFVTLVRFEYSYMKSLNNN